MAPREGAAIHRPATWPLECAADAKQLESRMKLLCDKMLKRLGQWLRVAGCYVLMLPAGASYRELIQTAAQEHRVLVT